jgi:soluble P-type ATPase
VSSHVLAAAVVPAATARGLTLSMPTGVEEAPGLGITGQVAGHCVAVGKADWLLGRGPNGTADSGATGGHVLAERPTWPVWVKAARRRADIDDALTAFVEIDGETVGVLLFDDPIRADAARTVRALRASGIERLVMVTGDRWDTAETIGAALGVDEVLAERTPTDKVDAVRLESRRGPTVMVGDGINDAPALAVAGIGVAVSARGATASSEAADAVLTVDRLDRVADAVVIARRSRMIARQSVLAGMGLSLTAMAVAALGWLPPAIGAALQEAIDVSVILNALRARMTPPGRTRLQGEEADLARRFRSQHDELRGIVARVRDVADSIGVASPYQLLGSVRSLHEELSGQLLPHEMAEDAELYPVIAGVLGGVDPTGPMSRAHVEIAHTIRRLGRFLDGREADTIDEVDLVELRRILYGLYALLELHFAQEDEGYFSMVEEGDSEQLAAGVSPEH